MILAVPEYTTAPTGSEQWDRYYDLTLDKLYIQTVVTTDPSYPNWVEMAEGAAVRDDMRREITLTRSLYSAKDYQTFLDEIVAYIRERWGDSFNDFMSSEPAMMIAEYVAAAFDQLSWYMDREVDDWYMELARVSGNIARLARYLGYKPPPSVSASVDVVFTLSSAPTGGYSFDVPIKAEHQVKGPNDLIFELATEQVIPAGDTTKTIGMFQGQTFTEVFVSDGTPNQVYELSLVPDGQYLAQFKTYLTVDLVEWSEVDFLPYSDDESYEILYLTSPPQIRFGNGVVGKMPPSGVEIRVSYVATRGNDGALATSGTVTENITPVIVNYQQIPVTVTNPDPASGGAPPATDEEIKAEAPRYFLAAERLVTEGDYQTLAGQFTSVSGAVAKANALIIRGVSQDLEMQTLMDAITADRTTLSGYLTGIRTNQDDIKAITGDVATADTIRNQTDAANTANTNIRTTTDLIDTEVTTVEGNIDDCDDHIDQAKTQLEFMSYQEIVGQGDGVTVGPFTKTLAMKPIREGSLTVFALDLNASKSATDGDCDTTPGRLIATAAPVFASTDVGKMIRIGGEYRQILKYVSTTTIEYSGPRIYGTSLLVDVYGAAIVGYSDTATPTGAISGTGITGSITWATGGISVTFTNAPEGISGKYGVSIITTYQYQATSIQSILDDALVDSATAKTNVGNFSTHGDTIDGYATASDGYMTKIDSDCDDIDTEATSTQTLSDDAGGVPTQMQNDIDELETYIDTIYSGDCKANVVRVSCLALDANGFYTAPTLALKQDLKTYLDERKIRSVQNSVVSGDYYLVKVKLDIKIKLEPLFIFQTVRALVLAAIDTMFKGRDYEQPLLRSEYYDAVDGIDGVAYSNNTIEDTAYNNPANTGTPPSVDSNGNLFVGEHEVVTKWSVTVTQIEE